MAFAAGAAAEWPALSVPLRMLAGLVGFSRVATGAHYPSDVLAGFALGETIAWLTTKVVPVERIDPMQDDLTVHAGKANPDGEGIALVLNPKSGSGHAGKILPEVRRAFPRRPRRCTTASRSPSSPPARSTTSRKTSGCSR